MQQTDLELNTNRREGRNGRSKEYGLAQSSLRGLNGCHFCSLPSIPSLVIKAEEREHSLDGRIRVPSFFNLTGMHREAEMGGSRVLLPLFMICLWAGWPAFLVRGEDPYLYFTWNVTYGTISPLGVPQKGILINDEFPGPAINSSSNNNVVINVFNFLDEPLLFTWYFIYFLPPIN